MLILLNSFRQVQYLSILEGSLADLIGASTLKRLGAYGELDISEQSGYITSYLIITTAKEDVLIPVEIKRLSGNR